MDGGQPSGADPVAAQDEHAAPPEPPPPSDSGAGGEPPPSAPPSDSSSDSSSPTIEGPGVLEAFVAPMSGEDEAGLDPRLAEQFESIETELAKIGGVELLEPDWPRVEALAHEILTTVGKDLRCLCHWTVARFQADGLVGLRQGLLNIEAVLKRFESKIYPRRPRGRASASLWMAERLEVGLAAGGFQATEAEQNELDDIVDRISREFRFLEIDTTQLDGIRASLREHIKWVASDEEREQEILSAFPEGFGPIGLSLLERASVEGEEESELTLRLRRVALWMASPPTLGTPSQRDTTTAPDSREELEAMHNGRDWPGLLAASEALFRKNPFWLDLTYWSAQAARHVVNEAARLSIIGELRGLLTRDEALIDCVDRDGGELASSTVRAWIAQEVQVATSGEGGEDASIKLPEEIGLYLEKEQLREAMLAAQDWIEVSTGRVRFARCVALANAFRDLGANDQSFLVFRGLHGHLRAMTVKEWEPKLFAACLEGYLSSKKASAGLGPEDEPLLEELSVLDPTAVLGVLPA